MIDPSIAFSTFGFRYWIFVFRRIALVECVPVGLISCVQMDFDQGEFDFENEGSEQGYRRWRERLDERKRAFEARWGVILGRRVRIQLRNHLKPLVGTLYLVQQPGAASLEPPRFRIRDLEFGHDELENIVREDDEAESGA